MRGSGLRWASFSQANGLVKRFARRRAPPKDRHGTKLARIRDPEGAEISLSS
jgi:hypothetical protein